MTLYSSKIIDENLLIDAKNAFNINDKQVTNIIIIKKMG
jgi:hypothetical protein